MCKSKEDKESLDLLIKQIEQCEDEIMGKLDIQESRADPGDGEWLRRHPRLFALGRAEPLFKQHSRFLADNAVWIVAAIEVMSLIGVLWCVHADFWCALGVAFFMTTAVFGVWAWERLERAAMVQV